MMRLRVHLCAALAATGCFFPGRTSRPAHTAAYVVDVALVALGAAYFIYTASTPDDDTGLKGLALTLGAGVAGAGGLGFLVNLAMPSPPPAPSPRP